MKVRDPVPYDSFNDPKSAKTRPLLIGIAGKAGSGKSTFAAYLADALSETTEGIDQTCIYSFASPIKKMLAVLGVYKGDPDFRRMAQTLGTEWGRDLIDGNIWVNAAREYVEAAPWIVIIDDVRFENEAEFIREEGILVHMKREGQLVIADPNHRSEAAVEFVTQDFTVENTSEEAVGLNSLAILLVRTLSNRQLLS